MASAQVKPQEEVGVVIEEETDVIQRTTEQISPSKSEKRKRDEEIPTESSKKYMHTSDGYRSATTSREQASLRVPFWKEISRQKLFTEFQTSEIDSFSLLNRGDEKEFFEDNRYLRIFKYPLETLNVNFDLKVGEADLVTEEQVKNVNGMLWWLLKHKEEVFTNNQFTFDFLSWRGVFRLIMFSIFEKQSDWLLAVIKFKNAYFLCEYVTELQQKNEQKMTPEQRSFCYYGHKFEEYVTRSFNTTETIDHLKQLTGVFRSTIGSNRLLYGAEMDCVVENASSKNEHIELKVCAGNSLDDLAFKYNRKFAKWWIQSFLVGIKTMMVGFRDNNGIVHKVSPLPVSKIEQTANSWNRHSFLNFFSLFANFVKQNVTDEYSLEHKEVTLFSYSPSLQRITMRKSTDPKYHFLSDRFVKEFQ